MSKRPQDGLLILLRGDSISSNFPLLDCVMNCFAELGDLRDSLKDVADIVKNLRMLGQKLRDGLSEVRKNLTEAKTECNNDEPSKTAGACDKIPSGDPLEADADFNEVMLRAKYDYLNSSFKNRILCYVCNIFSVYVLVVGFFSRK